MHNDTPLGATMHLKELNQQTAPKLSSFQAGKQEAAPVTALRTAMIALLGRLSLGRTPGQAASQD
jgi:hypothetical protein